jgi:hypothetical protein
MLKETLVSLIIQNSVKETRFTSLYGLAIDTLSFFILTYKSACNKDDLEQSNMIVIYFFGLPTFSGPSTTDETLLVEMRIWCIKIGIVLALHYIQYM